MTDPQLDAAEAAFRAAYLDPGLMRHALRKAVEAADKAAWQPMETAPRDGLHTCVALAGGLPILAFFHAGRCYWAHLMLADDAAAWAPTHWRPLPAPPESAP